MSAAAVIDWLLDSDPAIRWQVMRDLLGAPESKWAAERARVETEGWGARLLACQHADGQWAGGAFVPAGFEEREWREQGQPWTATCFALSQLREFGLDPRSARARRTVALVGANSRWEEGGQPFWEGEVEECINGRTVADGAYFGVDVAQIVERLLGERQADGGWNCERFGCRNSRNFGSAGSPVLRASSLLSGEAPDPRLDEAIAELRRRRLDDGRWPLDWTPRGACLVRGRRGTRRAVALDHPPRAAGAALVGGVAAALGLSAAIPAAVVPTLQKERAG